MARNPQFHKTSKHINTHWHWVQDQVEQKTLKIESCCDPQQTADVLTKALPRPKHQKHVTEMRPWDWQWHKGECRNTCIITMICDHVCDVTSNRCTELCKMMSIILHPRLMSVLIHNKIIFLSAYSKMKWSACIKPAKWGSFHLYNFTDYVVRNSLVWIQFCIELMIVILTTQTEKDID